MEALKLLLESDSLEGWQITEQAKEVLERLLNAWSGNGKAIEADGGPASIEQGPADGAQQTLADDDTVFPGDLEGSE
jgi:hypothetical protein